ncbi:MULTISPECIES: hypothetical protein [Enterobacter cloacae complex]|uniref:hypothetical protein n=1 Tax=Enterobacter cloacae complex TaxID=354276 RepID=UPI00065A4E6E|nr:MULTISPECIES: hypothetical protein [Enterobacter cloacae complex]EJV1482031.1 hypothetical protein [Enterobacter hormaechei]EKU4500372.1 hypothetical protein [Enterobacter hormaechei]EKW0705973.1 hypothetical protein [Enterobacter hormaechei]EKW0718875.1 hypothetical protein [Enterobacter hormaechei]ELC6362495.1 hypothetical protein [Enterobacter hormaechei]
MGNQKEQTVTIKIELNATDVQKKLEEIDDSLRNYDGFKIDRGGRVFINDAFISGVVHAVNPEDDQSVTNIYYISLGVRKNKPVQNMVTFTADRFECKIHSGVDDNIEALIENAVKNQVQSAVLDIKKQIAADRMTMEDLTSHIKNVMLLECFPNGILHRNFGRR